MKNKNSYKPYLIIDGYVMKKHLHGGFRIIEYFHYSDEKFTRKRTKAKHLCLEDADDMMYRLESKLSK